MTHFSDKPIPRGYFRGEPLPPRDSLEDAITEARRFGDTYLRKVTPQDALSQLARIIADQMVPGDPERLSDERKLSGFKQREHPPLQVPESASMQSMLNQLYKLSQNPPLVMPFTSESFADGTTPTDGNLEDI